MEISTTELKKGVKLCLKNARSLIKDANLLIDNGSYGHALFFVCTSLEEISKAFVYASSRLESQKIEEMKEARNHDIKYLYYLAFLLIDRMRAYAEKTGKKYQGKPLDVDDFRKFGEDLISSVKQMLVLREWSLYVDFKDKEWLSPFDVKREDATTMIAFAENYIKYVEWLCEIFLKTPSGMLAQLKEYIETQLVPSSLEELYKKKAISERVYLGMRESLEQAKRENNEKAYVSADLLRDDYARAMLDTCWTGIVAETDIERRVKLELLKARAKDLGFADDEIQIHLTRMDLDDYDKWLRTQENKNRTQTNGGEDCQRIVSEEELGGYLSKGWKVQAILPSGRIVVDNEH